MHPNCRLLVWLGTWKVFIQPCLSQLPQILSLFNQLNGHKLPFFTTPSDTPCKLLLNLISFFHFYFNLVLSIPSYSTNGKKSHGNFQSPPFCPFLHSDTSSAIAFSVSFLPLRINHLQSAGFSESSNFALTYMTYTQIVTNLFLFTSSKYVTTISMLQQDFNNCKSTTIKQDKFGF